MGEPADEPSIRAGGAVLWRPGADGIEVALIHRPRYDDWSFPKGKLKNGEHLLRAVVREVYEETGIWPVLGRRLPPRFYHKGDRLKRVDYWAATGFDGKFEVNDEVDEVVWVPLLEAEELLSYERDVDLLAAFTAAPARTVPYIVLRHASAGEKRDWRDDDLLRPLDARGRVESADMAELLACFGPARVVSSATARCLETVLPYAARVGADVRTDTAFTVGVASTELASERFLELLADEAPTIVCTHGEMVPKLVTEACTQLGAEPPPDPALRKASFWVLHVADDQLVATERHTSRP